MIVPAKTVFLKHCPFPYLAPHLLCRCRLEPLLRLPPREDGQVEEGDAEEQPHVAANLGSQRQEAVQIVLLALQNSEKKKFLLLK